MHPHDRRTWAAFAGLSLFWGSSYFWIKIGVESLPPLTLIAGRLLVGAYPASVQDAANSREAGGASERGVGERGRSAPHRAPPRRVRSGKIPLTRGTA